MKTTNPDIINQTPRLGTKAWCVVALAALLVALPWAQATPPGHNISAGNITVVQNDDGNTPASVTQLLSLTINDLRVRGSNTGSDTNSPQNSKGDFCVQIGAIAHDDFTNGLLISSITENGRDNLADGQGIRYGISMIENQRTNTTETNIIGAYLVSMHGSTNGGNNGAAGAVPEYNFNYAAAWFPYAQFVGGFARNHGPNDENGQNPGGWTNGGALNQLIGSPGVALGTEFFDLGSGKSHVVLTNLGIDSRTDGILLVTGAKNESGNFALSQVNTTNGGWNLSIKDQGQNTTANYEQDPIAFLYVAKTNTTIISGRFLGDASIAMYSGVAPQFTVTSNAAGVYELKVIGHQATNGVLVISPCGGETVNQDNFVHYQLNGTSDGWIIHTRDCAAAGLEAIPAAQSVVTFAFIPGPTPGFTVTPASGLLTTENGGTAEFTVVLDKAPLADVTLPVSSSNTGEGVVSTASLTFTASDWNTPQTVTITGQDDVVQDGAVAYTIILGAATSADANYSGLNPTDVSAVNADNEAGITVSPTSGLVTTEAGGTATFDIVLNTQPTADVTIGLSSGDTSEGSVSQPSVTFNSGNWSTPQTVTVTGMDDAVDDGNIAFTIITAAATSGDAAYDTLNPADVSVSNTDNDMAGATVSVGVNVVPVVEANNNTYTVVLDSQPTADVTVAVASSNPTQGGTAAPSPLTFTAGNWSTPQTVTVTGADDLVVDGNTYWTNTLAFSSSDPLYAGLSAMLVSIQTVDNEGVLTLPSGELIYGIGQAGVGIDGRATWADPNTPNHGGGNLTVSYTWNGTADDRLEVRNTGSGTGQIGVSGSTVSYEGTTIGTLAGGSGLTPLVITLNSSATPTATEALCRNVTFRNVSATPSLDRRIVSFVLTDGDGGVSSAGTSVRVGQLRYSEFQEGTDHGYGSYAGEVDIHLRQADPDTAYPAGSGGGLFIDYPAAGEFNAFHLLMRFDNIMGDGFGQIPSNAIIVSATLFLRMPPEDSNSPGDGSPLYRMLVPFDGTTDTWNGWVNGVDQDGIESSATAESEFGLVDGTGNTGNGTVSFSVLSDIVAWQGAAANYGWVMPGWPLRTDGTTVAPSEAANANDRARLRVLWLPAGTATTNSFRQNVNGYASATDTSLRDADPDADRSLVQTLFPDWSVTASGDNEHVLLRFSDIVGTGANQIPPGSRVHAAVLDLASTGANAMGHGGHFHAMLQPWLDTDTWNLLINGITANDFEAVSNATVTAGSPTLNPLVQGGFHTYEVTSDVQAWVKGSLVNHGWAVLPWTSGSDGWGFGSSEATTERNRPQLRVFYTGITITGIARGATSATIAVRGPANGNCTVWRATTINGSYGNIGGTTLLPDGTGTFTDNSPPAGAAFYKVSTP